MHSIVTTFREAVITVEVANFCAAMDTLIDQDALRIVINMLPVCQIYRHVVLFILEPTSSNQFAVHVGLFIIIIAT